MTLRETFDGCSARQKDMLAILQGDERPHGIPSAYIRPPFHVPESKKVDELLKAMRSERAAAGKCSTIRSASGVASMCAWSPPAATVR